MAPSTAETRVRRQLTDEDWQDSNTTTTLSDGAILTEVPPGLRELRFPFDGGELVVVVGTDLPRWVEQTVQSLGKLLELGPDWDTYGGAPVDPRCVAAALDLARRTFRSDTPSPSVVPTSRGGVQLEWHIGGVELEVEFLSATRICGLFEDASAGTSWEKDLSRDLQPLVDAISTLSQRQ
jgi:hypothetical protein